ncbi:thioesterase family protein [Marinobacter sp. CHS3-4]|uniref:acyl-CoA thioesterase n=1 Tax=Marinobacter sp. CHS3-4 TaxID=3045174 RepID=UPI0024B5A782|nr:thioesterase family protein [Marinobacter sp. CHS3-4]MDI9246240.1 thioesterase family protein [Marinobacter sp. CHS3-4]
MTFDELLSVSAAQNQITIPPSWGQGRATFGGLTAALLFERMADVVAEGRPMRSMQVSFVGPVKSDEPASLNAEILREGKAVSQAMGRIEQGDQPQLVAFASFGGGRDSSVAVDPLPAPDAPPPEECQPLSYIKNVTPEFTQHIEMRWAFGQMPFSGKGGREMGGWMQFREPPEEITDAHIVALVDAWPPALLPHLKAPAPASSLSWAMDILHPRPKIEPGDWLLYKATIDQAEAGYGHTQAGIWTQQGELVATSRQTVTVFG